MTQGARTARVGEEFREILAEQIPKLKDPRVGFITVTGVRVSPDLRHAWVSYTELGDDKAKAGSRAALRSATPYLRGVLGRQVRLKFLPEIEFQEDLALKRAEQIEALIAELHHGDGLHDEKELHHENEPHDWNELHEGETTSEEGPR